MGYKVLVTTSGLGSRLGDITKYTNKSLVKVGNKPAISYVIEGYPKSTHFVITVGYFADHVRDFLTITYPKHTFTFIEVDKFQGPGSSLGYSMLCAKKALQEPFIFHACDTIIEERVPSPTYNWIAGVKGEGSSLYRSFNVLGDRVEKMFPKGVINPDFIHVGLVGIKDYKKFFLHLEQMYKKNPNNQELSDVAIIEEMLRSGVEFKYKELKDWNDTGNVEGLQKLRSKHSGSFNVLEKSAESIFFFDTFVVKFFYDQEIVRKRVERAGYLKEIIPKIENSKGNFIRYKYINGELYSHSATPANFQDFLKWAEEKLWKKTREVDDHAFQEICYGFYFEKSKRRIQTFLKDNNLQDVENVINGEKVPPVLKMLEQIDFKKLCTAEQSLFHGDFIMDNIIQTKNGFALLDWREDFGGLIKAGDKYYDIAKLNHNLTVNHSIVLNNMFTLEIDKNVIYCDILRKENLVKCQEYLYKYLLRRGYDVQKVKLLTALIWLNMSPLHHHPFDNFLFYFGKLNLWRALNEK